MRVTNRNARRYEDGVRFAELRQHLEIYLRIKRKTGRQVDALPLYMAKSFFHCPSAVFTASPCAVGLIFVKTIKNECRRADDIDVDVEAARIMKLFESALVSVFGLVLSREIVIRRLLVCTNVCIFLLLLLLVFAKYKHTIGQGADLGILRAKTDRHVKYCTSPRCRQHCCFSCRELARSMGQE